MRTALLAAVSHDLRTPLASAKAAVGSLRSPDVDFDRRRTATSCSPPPTSRWTGWTGWSTNLLDMSRLQAGALGRRPAAAIGLEDVVPRALDELGAGAADVAADIPDDLPDGRWPTRACWSGCWSTWSPTPCGYSPPGQPPLITASAHAEHVELRVIDRGPGIPEDQWTGSSCRSSGSATATTQTGRRARAGAVPRPGRGDGRHARPGDHPRRRADHGRCQPARRRPRAGSGGPRMTRVLVVDDEPQILRALRINLRARGYDVAGRRRRRRPRCRPPPPTRPTWSCSTSACPTSTASTSSGGCAAGPRSRSSCCPAGPTAQDKVAALDAGADDYVTKPFGIDELLARHPRGHPSPHRAGGRRRAGDRPDRPAHRRPRRPRRSPRDDGARSGSPRPSGSCSRPAPQPRQAGQPAPAAARGVGAGVRRTRPTTCGSTWPSCAASSRRPGPPAAPAHRARHGLPLPALTGPSGVAPDRSVRCRRDLSRRSRAGGWASRPQERRRRRWWRCR